MDDLNTHLWLAAAVGRLAEQGLLERQAPAGDEVSVLAQRLLVEAGWLDTDPIRPSEAALAGLPPGAPIAAASGYLRERLGHAVRFVDGAPPGWAETDRDLIRWRGRASGTIVRGLFARHSPEALAEAKDFLDIGAGAAGIPIRLCGEFPELRAVALDISPTALDVAREEVTAAGFADRIEIRDQSVGTLDDVEAFDLVWLPQQFIPYPVVAGALPRIHRATRPGGTLVMALATGSELDNLMSGGGTLTAEDAAKLLEHSGFTDVRAWPSGVITGRR